jgi:hypothetical protein
MGEQIVSTTYFVVFVVAGERKFERERELERSISVWAPRHGRESPLPWSGSGMVSLEAASSVAVM